MTLDLIQARPAPASHAAGLHIRNLSVAYRVGGQAIEVLRHIDLDVAPGTYTIAWTCEADGEHPDENDGLTFKNSETLTVSASATSSVTFTE